MKNFKTKLLALVLVLATALSSAPLAVQAAVSAPTEATYYLSSKTDTSYGSIYLSGLSKSSEVTKIKSSKKSVVTLDYYEKDSYVNSYTNESLNSNDKYSSSYKDYSATIGFFMNKTGTSDITYTIGKKSYTTKVTVKKYTNPLETVEISGLKNGKSSNLKGLVDSSSNASTLNLKSDQKDAKIKLAAKKGWKIRNLYLSDNDYTFSQSIYSSKGLSSVTLNPGTLKKDVGYTLDIYMYNEEDGGELSIHYYIN